MSQEIKLYIFDLNGTLTNTPFIDHQPLALLPGRKEKLSKLKEGGATLAIATNKVAWPSASRARRRPAKKSGALCRN